MNKNMKPLRFLAGLAGFAGLLLSAARVVATDSYSGRPLLPASATIQPLDLSQYNDTMNSTFGNGNWSNVNVSGIVGGIFQPYVSALGPSAWIIVTGAAALALYIKTESLIMPGIIVIADGVLFMWWLPYDWQNIAYLLAAVGAVIVILGVVARRR